jgi:hypothetical protein
MIEPIRGQVGAYDISCSGCGVVERFTELRLGLLLYRLRLKGWRMLAGRHYCRECEVPAQSPAARPKSSSRFSASRDDLEELFGIEFDRNHCAAATIATSRFAHPTAIFTTGKGHYRK